ncbi:MAG: hypothetical protein H6982_03405 [Chromatiales bacterium]|nr:hypothetical protein [Chromatiales bacterium]
MAPELIVTLVVFTAFSALLFHVYVIRSAKDLGGLGKSGLVVLVGILIPAIVVVLLGQSRALARLAELGFEPYPGLEAASGVAVGWGDRPMWVFSVDDAAAALEFYRQPANRTEWELVADAPSMLLFVRGRMKVAVAEADGRVSVTVLEP